MPLWLVSQMLVMPIQLAALLPFQFWALATSVSVPESVTAAAALCSIVRLDF